MIEVGVFRLHDKAVIPSYGTSLSACFDLGFYPSDTCVEGYNEFNIPIEYIIMDDSIIINPGDRLLIPTGLVFKVFEKRFSVETFSDITSKSRRLKIGRAHV